MLCYCIHGFCQVHPMHSVSMDIMLLYVMQVNDSLQTTANYIFAVGDCCTMYKFTHAADFMARAVIRNALFFGSAKMSQLLIPRATFTEPEVGAVGKSEAELEEEGIKFEVVKKEMADNDRAVLDGATEGELMGRADSKGSSNGQGLAFCPSTPLFAYSLPTCLHFAL